MPWYKKLHWQIIMGMALGLIYGLVATYMGWAKFTADWIKPWGTIFINLLKLIAMPMIIASLICGVASLSDLTKLSRIGGKTILLYFTTTVIAVIIGLLLVNTLKPGAHFPKSIKEELKRKYQAKVEKSEDIAVKEKKRGPLDTIVRIIPQNVIDSASNNRNMLQMVFVALLIGIALVKAKSEKTKILRQFFEAMNDVVMIIVDLIMKIAPIGVFAQIAGVITGLAGKNPLEALHILKALGFYLLVVLGGLLIHVIGIYGLMIKIFTKYGIGEFFRGISDAQLIAFSTSSSAATLPVTKECCERELGIPEEITSFTLPVGATVNMDGTSLFQAVSVVFIAQILGMDLSLTQQIIIVLTCTLASIGAAGVPGAGVVMLVIVLQSINVPVDGIALIMGVERIIDMFRTVTNVTGDAAVTAVVANSEKKT